MLVAFAQQHLRILLGDGPIFNSLFNQLAHKLAPLGAVFHFCENFFFLLRRNAFVYSCLSNPLVDFSFHLTVENSVKNDPSITVIGDADRLQQLFSNVLENTLRYADSPGTLKIRQDRTANRLAFIFEDSGPGVPEEALARLFDRLYRVDQSRSRTQGGSGLGLSICKSIVNALGGEIRAARAASGGLRIEIELPLA